MARTRLKGKNIVFTYDGTEYQCDLVSAILEKVDESSAASTDGTQTFCDVSSSAGGLVWQLNIEAIQSLDHDDNVDTTDSLHTVLWEGAETDGGIELAFDFTPMAGMDHFTGTVIVPQGKHPTVGGASGENTWTFNYEFEVKDNTVTRVTA